MAKEFIAKAEIVIERPASVVWAALTTPEIVKQWLFGTTVISDWKVGSPLMYKGEGVQVVLCK